MASGKEVDMNKPIHALTIESPSEAVEQIDLLLQDHKAGWLTSKEVLNRITQMLERTNISI